MQTLPSEDIVDRGRCLVGSCCTGISSLRVGESAGLAGGSRSEGLLCGPGAEQAVGMLVSSTASCCLGVTGALPPIGAGGKALATAVISTLEIAADLRWRCLDLPWPGLETRPGGGVDREDEVVKGVTAAGGHRELLAGSLDCVVAAVSASGDEDEDSGN